MSGSAGHDCVDASTGSGTAGTANTWSGNIAATDEPAGICATSTTPGYRLVAANGSVSNFGGALDHGSVTSEKIHLNAPVVGMADAPDDAGYWLVAADGGVFTFGAAGFYGSRAGRTSTPRSWASRPPLTAGGTGSWRPTAGSSPSATPASLAPWVARA